MINRIVFVSFIFLGLQSSYAQDYTACLTKHQLIKMQSSTLNDVRPFMNKEGWQFDGAQTDKTYLYFDIALNYDLVMWEKRSYNWGKIMLFTSPQNPNIVAFQSDYNCFQTLLEEFSSNAGTTTVDDNKLVTTYRMRDISVEFREYKDDYSSRQYSVLVYNRADLNEQIEGALEQKARYEDVIIDGNFHFHAGQIELARSKYMEANRILPSDSVLLKIKLCNVALSQDLILEGDSLRIALNFEDALSKYHLASSYGADSAVINQKIKEVKRAEIQKILVVARRHFLLGNFDSSRTYYLNVIEKDPYNSTAFSGIQNIETEVKRRKVLNLLSVADEFFDSDNYDSAKIYYKKVLIEDSTNESAIGKLKTIREIEEILALRKSTVFSYKEINAHSYNTYLDRLTNHVNDVITANKKGHIQLDFDIRFDTSGGNNSKINVANSSDSRIDEYLTKTLRSDVLAPSEKMGYRIASSQNVTFNTKWYTEQVTIKYTHSGFTGLRDNFGIDQPIRSFINAQSFRYGKYTCTIKHKKYNENLYYDISLKNYKVVGPGAAFYSMIMPGLGTLKVTYGKKGKGRLLSFILSAAVAGSAKLYSDQQYSSYMSATKQSDMDNYYSNANIGHQIALVAAGISTSIYLYDIIWVCSHGVKNRRNSNDLRHSLNGNPRLIQSQNIKIQ